jgi:DNA-binding NarL/FixJ family response regulator
VFLPRGSGEFPSGFVPELESISGAMVGVRTRVLLVDDQPDILESLKQSLEPEFIVVGTAMRGEGLLAIARSLRPQVIVLDVVMPGMSGIEAAERVRRGFPDAKIVMLSMHADELYVDEALRAGASGYVIKSMGASELARAIREVRAGRRYLSPSLRAR